MNIQKLFFLHFTDVFAFLLVVCVLFLLLCTNHVICLDDGKICFCKIRANNNYSYLSSSKCPRTVAIIVAVIKHRILSPPSNNGDFR